MAQDFGRVSHRHTNQPSPSPFLPPPLWAPHCDVQLKEQPQRETNETQAHKNEAPSHPSEESSLPRQDLPPSRRDAARLCDHPGVGYSHPVAGVHGGHLQQKEEVQQQSPVPGGGGGASPPVLPPHGWRPPCSGSLEIRPRGWRWSWWRQRRASPSPTRHTVRGSRVLLASGRCLVTTARHGCSQGSHRGAFQ